MIDGRHLTLVVMAAGLGSRFGGLKQLQEVGPSGESILEYSIYDAVSCGFDSVLFVIRSDMHAAFHDRVGRRLERFIEIKYAFQDAPPPESSIIAPPARRNPWGTGYAALLAASVITGAFAIINADDFYGRESFRKLETTLSKERGVGVLVAFKLSNTLSDFGPVRRGICEVTPSGFLSNVREVEEIERVRQDIVSGDPSFCLPLSGDVLVSMNMWGFSAPVFQGISEEWNHFIRLNGRSSVSEFYLPTAVAKLMETGSLRCRVVETSSRWFGLTYLDDLPAVRERIRRLVDEGMYPPDLWHRQV